MWQGDDCGSEAHGSAVTGKSSGRPVSGMQGSPGNGGGGGGLSQNSCHTGGAA